MFTRFPISEQSANRFLSYRMHVGVSIIEVLGYWQKSHKSEGVAISLTIHEEHEVHEKILAYFVDSLFINPGSTKADEGRTQAFSFLPRGLCEPGRS